VMVNRVSIVQSNSYDWPENQNKETIKNSKSMVN